MFIVWRFDSDLAAGPRVLGFEAVSLDIQFHKMKAVGFSIRKELFTERQVSHSRRTESSARDYLLTLSINIRTHYSNFLISSTSLIHTSLFTLLSFTVSTCFGHYLAIRRRQYTNAGCSASWGWASNARNMSRLWTSIKWKVKRVSSWYCLLRNYATMIHGQQNVKYNILNFMHWALGYYEMWEPKWNGAEYGLWKTFVHMVLHIGVLEMLAFVTKILLRQCVLQSQYNLVI
jgi:hypothetical protein